MEQRIKDLQHRAHLQHNYEHNLAELEHQFLHHHNPRG